jgi:hypothetical protein
MKLFSAVEDFVNETLASIPSKLGRLRFIAAMNKNGSYKHWGMSKRHGADEAQKAISEAHSDSFEKVLTSPVPNLALEEHETAEYSGRPEIELASALPSDLRGGTRRHLKWILRVVGLLSRDSKTMNPDA